MFKKVFAVTLLFSVLAHAERMDLSCHQTTRTRDGRSVTLLAVEKLDSVDGRQSGLRIRNRHGEVKFTSQEIDVTDLKYHKVILMDNGYYKARIVINSQGQADVSMQDPNGTYLIERKVIPCSVF
jgi:hypothetical protein